MNKKSKVYTNNMILKSNKIFSMELLSSDTFIQDFFKEIKDMLRRELKHLKLYMQVEDVGDTDVNTRVVYIGAGNIIARRTFLERIVTSMKIIS